jgi:hypothetical protein
MGRPRSVDRARLLQFDPPAAEILEESGAVAEQDGDEVDLHLAQQSRLQILRRAGQLEGGIVEFGTAPGSANLSVEGMTSWILNWRGSARGWR